MTRDELKAAVNLAHAIAEFKAVALGPHMADAEHLSHIVQRIIGDHLKGWDKQDRQRVAAQLPDSIGRFIL